MKNKYKQISDYWDHISLNYKVAIHITTNDFHYGPLIPGDSKLKLLPNEIEGKKVLELGAGQAQNSIFLSKKGAKTWATDISEQQIRLGKEIAEKEKCEIDFSVMPMEEIDKLNEKEFDLIHSSYAINFSADIQKVFNLSYELLKENGEFIFSTAHPLFSGEFLTLDSDTGLFLENYFKIDADCRYDDKDNKLIESNFYTIEELSRFAYNAGFLIKQILEPQCIDISNLTTEECIKQVPYYSNGWSEFHEQLRAFPGVVIFKLIKL